MTGLKRHFDAPPGGSAGLPESGASVFSPAGAVASGLGVSVPDDSAAGVSVVGLSAAGGMLPD
jgi:hypothetical protein